MTQMITHSSLCLMALLGLTLFASPVTAQVFDNVINLPPAPDIGDDQSIGGDGLATQLNISVGGNVGKRFVANSGSEVNISGGTVRYSFNANSGSEVNISGGSVTNFFNANSGSVVNVSGGSVGEYSRASSGSTMNIGGGFIGNYFGSGSGSVVNISGGSVGCDFVASGEVNISGGSVGNGFEATSGSAINLFGSDFFLSSNDYYYEPLDDSLTIGDAFTIDDRDVTLSGRLADGLGFSFDLSHFDSTATLTVTLVSPVVESILGDCNQDGEVTALDIAPMIETLIAGTYLAQADCNQDGVVDFSDIPSFIAILTAA